MKRYRTTWGLLAVLVLSTAILFAPHPPDQTNADEALQQPDSQHWLGTDALGRDILTRFLNGGRRSLSMAVLSLALAALLGISLGVIASSSSRLVGTVATLFTNAWLALPQILIAFVVLTLLGAGGGPLAVAVGIAQVGAFAQVTRSAIASSRGRLYLEAAYALGATPRYVFIEHVLPAMRPILLAYSSVVFSYCLLNSAALSTLGLGGELGVADWGVMLAEGRMIFRLVPWESLSAGFGIILVVSVMNRISDTLTFSQHE